MNKLNSVLNKKNNDKPTLTTSKKLRLIIICTLALVVTNFFFQAIKYMIDYDKIISTPATTHIKLSVFAIVMSAIVSPFIEETLFRGMLLNYFSKYYLKTSVIVLSLLFASLHLDLFFYPYFFSSIILSYAYLKSNKDLKISFSVHALYNSLCLLFLLMN